MDMSQCLKYVVPWNWSTPHKITMLCHPYSKCVLSQGLRNLSSGARNVRCCCWRHLLHGKSQVGNSYCPHVKSSPSPAVDLDPMKRAWCTLCWQCANWSSTIPGPILPVQVQNKSASGCNLIMSLKRACNVYFLLSQLSARLLIAENFPFCRRDSRT